MSNPQVLVKKCPACGAMLESFSTHCPSCGTEIASNQAANSVSVFAKELADMDAQRDLQLGDDKKSSGISFGKILLWIFFYPFMAIYYIIKLLRSVASDPEFDGLDQRKQNYCNVPRLSTAV